MTNHPDSRIPGLGHSLSETISLPPMGERMSVKKFPYPSEFNVRDFVPKGLCERNYEKWKSLMLGFIERQDLMDFIDGTVPEEDKTAEQDNYKAWKRTDNLVHGWILATLNEDRIMAPINEEGVRLLDTKSARDLWKKLANLFDPALSIATYEKERDERLTRYLPLHRAVIKGDWVETMQIIEQAEEADVLRIPITPLNETALTVAIRSERRNHFVRKLLEKMTAEDVEILDEQGRTALHLAARMGNIEGAKMLVVKNPELANMKDTKHGRTPLHFAAERGFRDMVLFLKGATRSDILLEEDVGAQYLRDLISGELYDLAFALLKGEPELARKQPTPLDIIVKKGSSFRSGSSFNFWQKLIYLGVPNPVISESIANQGGDRGSEDIECPSPTKGSISVGQRLYLKVWEVAEKCVPLIKRIREKKLSHYHAAEIVKVLCMQVTKLKFSDSMRILKPVMQNATQNGIPEIVEEITLSQPMAMLLINHDGRNTIHDAILWRRERVFNLIYQMDVGIRLVAQLDRLLNNGLHLAAHLGPEQKVNLRASAVGPVLQMQRELQWYKEVEKFTPPSDKEKRNAVGMTPAEVFSDTHQDLMKEGEHWIKDTATSCTIVAALIATMVFAAAITVPGGINIFDGTPLLSTQKAFVIFGISDALALFSSITSILMFLLILTSRYAQDDFLHILPNRLVIGLISLFVSILSTMIAFGAIIYILFGNNKAWILIPVVGFVGIPVTLFGAWQFPLLVEMVQSTYGRGIFGKQGDRVLQ